uniref:Palmitoyltransferase ZDHHC23 n=1 Tax=Culex pipiens TaxID=7175 RepID=A0A8D8G7W8_CULPI
MNSHFASYPGDIIDDCYQPELDTDPLCCCEYYDRNAARNHILACCCNCTDVDESFDSPFPTGTVSRNTIRSNSGAIVGLQHSVHRNKLECSFFVKSSTSLVHTTHASTLVFGCHSSVFQTPAADFFPLV